MKVHFDGDETKTTYNDEGNLRDKDVVKGETIISKADAESMFDIETLENDVYMKFKGSTYDFLYPRYNSTYTLSLSSMGDRIKELEDSFSRRTLISSPTEDKDYYEYLVRSA